jgi:molybdenum cofactor cytidylyltransferase
MGRPKLLLSLGGKTVLEHVVSAVLDGGVENVLIVVAPGADPLAELASSTGAEVLRLDDDTPDMRATCVRGLAWMQERWRPEPSDGWLLLPADHPTTSSAVVAALLAAARTSDRSIVIPVHQGRRGHPAWLSWAHVNAIAALSADQGLNTFIRSHAGDTLEFFWESEEILRDLDTPADYERLRREV